MRTLRPALAMPSRSTRLARWEMLNGNNSRSATADHSDGRWSFASSEADEDIQSHAHPELSEASKKRLFAWKARFNPSPRHGIRRAKRDTPSAPPHWVAVAHTENYVWSAAADGSHAKLDIKYSADEIGDSEHIMLSVDGLAEISLERVAKKGLGTTERFQVSRRGASGHLSHELETVHRDVRFTAASHQGESTNVREFIHASGDATVVRKLIDDTAAQVGATADTLLSSLRGLPASHADMRNGLLLASAVANLSAIASCTSGEAST
mmetsp:Transcript_4516/g.11937  ORF Transcript_4516/g.11937 Transcript_4516/m.11937 type:complete len:267 (+) Transcript_4516:107-907(+)